MTNIEIPRHVTSAIDRAAKFEAIRRDAGIVADSGTWAEPSWGGIAEGVGAETLREGAEARLRLRTQDLGRRRTDFGVLEVVAITRSHFPVGRASAILGDARRVCPPPDTPARIPPFNDS